MFQSVLEVESLGHTLNTNLNLGLCFTKCDIYPSHFGRNMLTRENSISCHKLLLPTS